MSLDVYLTVDGAGSDELEPVGKIYIRENGSTKAISEEEWNRRYPGREPVRSVVEPMGEVYSANITHNLGRMAEAAGVYDVLWQPDMHDIEKASQLIAPLQAGLAKLKAQPELYAPLNPSNGWGNYDGLVEFVASYLAACEQYPDAKVSVSR